MSMCQYRVIISCGRKHTCSGPQAADTVLLNWGGRGSMERQTNEMTTAPSLVLHCAGELLEMLVATDQQVKIQL